MEFLSARIQGFRNIEFAELDLAADRLFFCAPNAQGKSNLMEALGFVTALRSFRTHEQRVLVRQGERESRLFFAIKHERFGDTEVQIVLRSGGKEVYLDGEKVGRFSDFVGQFPVVAFSAQDIQLLRGSPSLRRRFLDLTLASMDPSYLEDLQRYYHALQARNQLLKEGVKDALSAFEKMLAEAAVSLIAKRRHGVEVLSRYMGAAYCVIAAGAESIELGHVADIADANYEALLEFYAAQRKRDALMKSTQRGPHRDDLVLKIDGKLAKDYASEGQQRGLVLALRLAQVAYFNQQSGIRPVVLADDILGELDSRRRLGFYRALDPSLQVLATGTQVPENIGTVPWLHFSVCSGSFHPQNNYAKT